MFTKWSPLALVCAASLLGCAGGALPATRAPTFVATHIEPPEGTVLEQACTPTGPELCFNAIDDNCNGVIDEGCGLQTGVLQFTIAWAGAADVNLSATTPTHERIPEGRSRSPVSGFHVNRDCPADGCAGQNVENIYFDGDEPPRGHYEIEITLADLKGADSPVDVRFGARLGSRSASFDVKLAEGKGAEKRFAFDL